jgi:PAS domain S-box-containing protein
MTSPSEDSSYHAYVEKAPIGIFEVNEHGEYVNVNEAACDMIGYSRDEMLEMSVADLVPGQDDTEGIPSFTEIKRTEHVRTEGKLPHKDGHMVDVLLEAIEIDEGRFRICRIFPNIGVWNGG